MLGAFIEYSACTGQHVAEQLGYSPLPENLVELVFDAIRAIPGAANPPPIKQRNNPTIQGGFDITGGPDVVGQPGDGAGGPTGAGEAGGPKGDTGPTGEAAPSASASVAADLLSSEEIESLRALAAQDAAGAEQLPALPLVIAGLVVLLIVFGPLFLRLRNKDPGDGSDAPGDASAASASANDGRSQTE